MAVVKLLFPTVTRCVFIAAVFIAALFVVLPNLAAQTAISVVADAGADPAGAATVNAPGATPEEILGETASPPAEDLQQRLTALDGVVASFVQQITDARGALVEASSGSLYLAKPDFRWEVAEPFPQIIIARGDQLQIYDPDLEQLTIRTLTSSAHLEDTPLTLLTREHRQLADSFRIDVNYGAGLAHFALEPLAADALFATLEMVFAEDVLQSLIITDHTGQQSVIRLQTFKSDQHIDAGMFKLELPAGIDIVRG